MTEGPLDRPATPPLVRASIALHLAAAGGYALWPAGWPWVLGTLAANHLVLSAAGLLPRSGWLGANLTQLPPESTARAALTFDDGPDPCVTPRVLDLLERHRAIATFFCIGERVAAHPALTREIVARGHAVENHSARHLHRFALLGPGAMRAEVARAQETITGAIGEAPRFFRAPAGLRNPFLAGVLAPLGLRLASWTRRGFDTVERNPGTVLARLVHGLRAGDILLLHDGHAARTASGTPVVLDVLPRLCAALAAAGLETVTLRRGAP
jgi:peptidoglycan/xylan/chitin deacetylase (PgdA/CDA1 family)